MQSIDRFKQSLIEINVLEKEESQKVISMKSKRSLMNINWGLLLLLSEDLNPWPGC